MVRSRAESFTDQDPINLDQKIGSAMRSSYDSIMKANVSAFEEPEPDTYQSGLRKPTQLHNLPPIIKPSTARQLERRRTIQYKRKSQRTSDFDILSCSGISSTQEKLEMAREE